MSVDPPMNVPTGATDRSVGPLDAGIFKHKIKEASCHA